MADHVELIGFQAFSCIFALFSAELRPLQVLVWLRQCIA